MKAEIHRRYPDLQDAPNNKETLERLRIAAKEAWHSIDRSILRRLVDTMPHRVEAIIASEGWYTKY